MLAAWAEAQPLTDERAASRDQIERHLEFIAATLPSKNVDDSTGRSRFAVYVSILGGFSEQALAFMSRRACQTLRWFPVPVECLDIIREYRAPTSQRETALMLCHSFMQESFDRWLANLRAGQPIGDVPDQWKRIAIENGALRRLPGGTIVSRALYHGPIKPYAAQ